MSIFSHPLKKLTLLAAFGGGYVFGAKAGRERYEQIRQTATQVKEDPRVKQVADRAEDLVREAATKVTEDPRVKDVVTRAEDILRDAGLKHDDESEPAAPNTPAASAQAAPAATAAVPTPPPTPAAPAGAHRLETDDAPLDDDEIVYTTGPDIEETIDELIDLDAAEQTVTDRDRDNS